MFCCYSSLLTYFTNKKLLINGCWTTDFSSCWLTWEILPVQAPQSLNGSIPRLDVIVPKIHFSGFLLSNFLKYLSIVIYKTIYIQNNFYCVISIVFSFSNFNGWSYCFDWNSMIKLFSAVWSTEVYAECFSRYLAC